MDAHDTSPDIPRDPARGRPIDADNAADLFDVILHPDDRIGGCICFLILDADGYLLTPFLVEEPPVHTSRASRERALEMLLESMLETFGCGITVAFARGREGSLMLRDEDRAWHEVALEASAAAEVRLIGCWLATDAGLRAYPPPLSEALSTIPA